MKIINQVWKTICDGAIGYLMTAPVSANSRSRRFACTNDFGLSRRQRTYAATTRAPLQWRRFRRWPTRGRGVVFGSTRELSRNEVIQLNAARDMAGKRGR